MGNGLYAGEMNLIKNKYSLKNPEQIKGILNEFYPESLTKLSENTIEMLDF